MIFLKEFCTTNDKPEELIIRGTYEEGDKLFNICDRIWYKGHDRAIVHVQRFKKTDGTEGHNECFQLLTKELKINTSLYT